MRYAIELSHGVDLPFPQTHPAIEAKGTDLGFEDGREAHTEWPGVVQSKKPLPKVMQHIRELLGVDALWRHKPLLAFHDFQRIAQRMTVLAWFVQPELMPGKLDKLGYCALEKFPRLSDSSTIWSIQ